MMARSRMTTMRVFLAMLLVIGAAGQAFGQTADSEASAAPRTGDSWVDDALVDMAAYAGRHRNAFVDELVRYQAAPRALVNEALASNVPAGDVYYACAVAQALGRPCRELLDAATGSDEGWAARVRAVDGEQSATALARVKRGIVESYRRWARPIALDASLRRDFPDR